MAEHDVDAESLLKDSHKKILGVMLVVILAAGVAVVAMDDLSLSELQPGESEETAPEEVSEENGQEEAQRTGLTEADIEGEIIDVVIDDQRAEPSSPTIGQEDGIRFVSESSYDLQVEFDREVETFTLAQGDSVITNPESIVYYTANPVDESVEFREISARVNVQ